MTLSEVIENTPPGTKLQGPHGWRGTVLGTVSRGVRIEWRKVGFTKPELSITPFASPGWRDITVTTDREH